MIFSLFTMSNKQKFLFCFDMFCIVFEAESHCDSDCPGSPCVNQACLKLTDPSACLCLHLYLCLPEELTLKLCTTTPSFKSFRDEDTNGRDEHSPVNWWTLCARSDIMQLRDAIQRRQTIHRNRTSQAWDAHCTKRWEQLLHKHPHGWSTIFHTQQAHSNVFQSFFAFILESCPKAQRQEAFVMNDDQNRQKCLLM